MNECPCKDCTERTVDCHGKCEKYLAWAKENEKRRNHINLMNRSAYLQKREKPVRRRKV